MRVAGPGAAGKLTGTWRQGNDRSRLSAGLAAITASPDGPVRALGFVADRSGPRYTGRRPEAELAHDIARACGHAGPSAVYLFETWAHCRAAGIRDPMLERLARLVARSSSGVLTLVEIWLLHKYVFLILQLVSLAAHVVQLGPCRRDPADRVPKPRFFQYLGRVGSRTGSGPVLACAPPPHGDLLGLGCSDEGRERPGRTE